ncbi:serine hydrolase [Nocardioides sp. Root151]|uniref:serine hydrolase n=1 Tax=Nocardioides sp. Root151 TaxID=1736475 RepID=UPI000702BDB4|nr:serine hydrolase [Nocardioides sp. Root151]KQZ75990.1 hypothetical protein ASD66_06770 [Nocardioides sp. Root151]
MSGAASSAYGFSGEAVEVAHEIRQAWSEAGLRGAFSARNLDTGEELGFEPDLPFPLASVSKVPLALVVLDLIACGELDAERQVTLDPKDRTPGPTGISSFRHPTSVAVEDLVLLMLTVSDNAAADALFEITPPAAVADRLAAWGCTGIQVRHPIRTLYDAVSAASSDDPVLALELAIRATTGGGGHVLPALDSGTATCGTSRGLVDLMDKVWNDRVSVPTATARLRELLGGQVNGARLASGLSSDLVRVHSKTGTFLNLRHEAGTICSSAGDRIAVAALTASTVPSRVQPEAERAIALAGRAAFEVLRF